MAILLSSGRRRKRRDPSYEAIDTVPEDGDEEGRVDDDGVVVCDEEGRD